MDQVTLDEVRQELSNWPLVMREQQMGSEVVELEIKNTEADRAKYPRLFAFLEMARADANAASSLDAQIPFPEVIVISANETQGAAFSAITFDDGKKGRLLSINPLMINRLSDDMLVSTLAHEFAHYHHHPKILAGENRIEQRRLYELEADRYAANPLSKACSILTTSPARHYFSVPADSTHPPVRLRVRALLEEAYGNEVFRMSGAFDDDYRFQPLRVNALPVLENGIKVKNWDTQIAPAIRASVDADMVVLDQLVAAEQNQDEGMGDRSMQAFIDYLLPRINDFLKKNILSLEAPSAEYIAQQFQNALADSTLRERVTEMHQAMQWAFKAYDETVTYCNQTFVSADMQNAVIEAVKQRLVEGILHQVYPSSTSEISDNYSIMQPGN